LDVGFVVDSSGSVAEHFETIQGFVKKIIDGFDIGRYKTHVALMTFSNAAHLQFALNDSFNAENVKEFVDRARHDGGQTYIDKALDAANRKIFSVDAGWRPNVTSVSTHQKPGWTKTT
jgi:hypothetical protein